ncbi:hypothetical protein [Escherichia sp. E1130]|uniref:hypothetical protein n=1 Tax=Escherichia sp. E1130 TaxID=2041645 RepID=UPI001081FE4A|nr:hypothetical protein [Escherichia sp. E1130]TGC25304.1 hypothetical protein CQJ27_12585 [Escherichia sp. E1130]TLI72918.1 hypothetical protein FEK66_08175 [Escherichia sp. E1130]
MQFNELSSESRSQAKIALGQLIVARANSGVSDFEYLGRCIAAAFIAMERHDSTCDKCGDGQNTITTNAVTVVISQS